MAFDILTSGESEVDFPSWEPVLKYSSCPFFHFPAIFSGVLHTESKGTEERQLWFTYSHTWTLSFFYTQA